MKSICQITGYGAARPQRWSVATAGAVMLAIAWSGWAAEPTTDDRRQTTDGGGQRSEVRDQLNPAAPAPVMFVPPGESAGGTNAAGRPPPFSAEISADFIKKIMETSAKIEEAKRQIADRQAKLYATNPDIKANRELMVKHQMEINRILDADPELTELKMSRDILWSTMPALPKTRSPISLPKMPSNR